DYRFRGPDLLLFRASLEHSLGKLPIGAFFSVDGGKIALRRDDVSLDHLRHSFNVGLTVPAGGLPVFYLLFSWAGNESTHPTATTKTPPLHTTFPKTTLKNTANPRFSPGVPPENFFRKTTQDFSNNSASRARGNPSTRPSAHRQADCFHWDP